MKNIKHYKNYNYYFLTLVSNVDSVSAIMHYDYVMHNLAFTYFVFLIGITGIIYNNKNFFLTMLSIEIMYLGLTLSFLMIGSGTSDPLGQIYALVLLVVAAAESAIGLGILIVLYRCGRTIEFTDYEDLRG
jgi:NADH:ubiquinone oxidoreductase subunit K